MKFLQAIHQIIFELESDNIEESTQTTVEFFDQNFPMTFNLVITQNICTAYSVQYKDVKIYLNYLKLIEDKEEKILNKNPEIIQMFKDYVSIHSNELKYLYADLVNSGIIEQKRSNLNMKLFLSIKDYDLEEIMKYNNDLNPMDFLYAIAYVYIPIITFNITKDDIDKLQEISTHANFDINQRINSTYYEKCLLMTDLNGISLIDYAAYFGSIKCFKYLLINGSKIENAGKYAVAGGNIEIIHLCEQNHATFKGSCEAAIRFHRNDIFQYIYKKNYLEPDKAKQNYFFGAHFQLTEEEQHQNRLSELAINCIQHNNYEIFLFLEENGLIINNDIVHETLRKGNIYFAKYVIKGKEFPKDSLVYACASANFELINYIFKHCNFDINEKDIYLLNLIFFQFI